MRVRQIIKLTVCLLFICIAAGTGMFLYNAYHSYTGIGGFTPIPLDYNPDDSTSHYNWKGAGITAYGGFVKGIQKESGGDILVIRALSPLPAVEVKAASSGATVTVRIENINPEFYATSIDKGLGPSRISVNTLEFAMDVAGDETKWIKPSQPTDTQSDQYVILGDSRDGYETFDEIIAQVNAINPAFVIDNGDLVYSGKPNQYRIFDRMAEKFSSTLCTTLGNHDIRGSGRETYTTLYGPAYYSFDFGENHFVFLDSSRGYAEMRAIPDEQYAWLERDLQKAQGKRIFVISHVPPVDPRSGLQPNEIEAYTDKVKQEGGFVEKKLEEYSEDANIDHGFRDKQEAQKFESLMTQYKVAAVYLSHIHSYFDYTKDSVRYIISGGAGAELLTQNSYYHYLIAKAGTSGALTMVQLPSPPNLLLQRYAATISLFSKAMYAENKAAVVLILSGLSLLVALILLLLYLKLKNWLAVVWALTKDTGKYLTRRYKELKKG